MNGGSLGMRSGSNGTSQQQQQQLQTGLLPIQVSTSPPPPARKSWKVMKENLALWIFKSAGRKKVWMVLLCLISAAVFLWVLCVDKGDETQEVAPTISIYNDPSDTVTEQNLDELRVKPGLPLPPPPPSAFLGYTLPRGHPCKHFALPPPPADKKRTGPRPCPVCYLPVEEAIALMPKVPSYSPVLKNLSYITEENLNRETEFGGSDFGGYPTLKQRTDSYDIRESMSVHCGFVKSRIPGHGTGYDMDEIDRLAMDKCHGVVVSSAIFGNFDEIQQPKHISEHSRKTVCFFMFVDEETEEYLRNTSAIDSDRKSGIWRVILVRNLPYTDGRRTGKIPKLLIHRMFPNARFSLWIDGKLELVVDPYQILERFLWRTNATFAISRHYKRFDTFTEAEANKAAKKYDNASIDFQIEFYRNEGLTPYSEAKLPITSDVPEGCVIMREHVPISNLFACLWQNEVDRFTSRDQISFSTVRDKIHSKTNWTINMFLDCERRNFVVQKYHREVLARRGELSPPVFPPPLPPPLPPPPPPLEEDPSLDPETEAEEERTPETLAVVTDMETETETATETEPAAWSWNQKGFPGDTEVESESESESESG